MRSPRPFLALSFALAALSLAALVWPLASGPAPGASAILAQKLSVHGRVLAHRLARRIGYGEPAKTLTNLDPFLPSAFSDRDSDVSVTFSGIVDPALMRALERPLVVLPTPISAYGQATGVAAQASSATLDRLLSTLAERDDGGALAEVVDAVATGPDGDAIYAAMLSGPTGRPQALLTVRQGPPSSAAEWTYPLAAGAVAAAIALFAVFLLWARPGPAGRALRALGAAFDAPESERSRGQAESDENDDAAIVQARRALRQVILANAAFGMLEGYLDRKGVPKAPAGNRESPS